METKYRLRICGMHIGYLCPWILHEYIDKFSIMDIRYHVRDIIKREFNIWIMCQEDIDRLQEIVKKRHYESLAEWLQEYMRNQLNSIKEGQ